MRRLTRPSRPPWPTAPTIAEVALEKKHQGEMLRGALTKLSPEHREIIDLVYYHEKSVDDAAQVLGIPAATVKTRMFYARKKLAELVQEPEMLQKLLLTAASSGQRCRPWRTAGNAAGARRLRARSPQVLQVRK